MVHSDMGRVQAAHTTSGSVWRLNFERATGESQSALRFLQQFTTSEGSQCRIIKTQQYKSLEVGQPGFLANNVS